MPSLIKVKPNSTRKHELMKPWNMPVAHQQNHVRCTVYPSNYPLREVIADRENCVELYGSRLRVFGRILGVLPLEEFDSSNVLHSPSSVSTLTLAVLMIGLSHSTFPWGRNVEIAPDMFLPNLTGQIEMEPFGSPLVFTRSAVHQPAVCERVPCNSF